MSGGGVYDREVDNAVRRRPIRHVVALLIVGLTLTSWIATGRFGENGFLGLQGQVLATGIDFVLAVGLNLAVVYGIAGLYWWLRNRLHKRY
jgi:hypothetical protein